MNRCKWCNLYHDNEWCRLNFNEEYLIEMFILESFQAGLSWECILNKREALKLAFDNFLNVDPKKSVKALLMNIKDELVVLFIRGDRELNETKVCKLLGCSEVNFAAKNKKYE